MHRGLRGFPVSQQDAHARPISLIEHSGDESDTVHIVCCQEWTDLGPSLCGTPLDNPEPAREGVDQDCVVCADLYANDEMLCPRFGRCDLESFQ